MSNLAYAPASAPAPRREQPVRRVEVVASRSQRRLRPRPLYAIITVGGLFALFIAQLMLSIGVSDGAYQISSLQGQKVALARTQTNLSEQVDTLASTQNLAAKAESLGMVLSTSTPAFLDAQTGKVIGKSKVITVNKAVIDDTGSLVPNSLLQADDDTADASLTGQPSDGTATDGTSTTSDGTGATTATNTDSSKVTVTVTKGTGSKGATSGGSTGTTSSGAPAGSTRSGSVTSSNTLPVPVLP